MLSDEEQAAFFFALTAPFCCLPCFICIKMADKPYLPIACNLYDRLTDLATRRHKVSLVVRTGTDEISWNDVIIADIVTRNKEEFLVTACGRECRLDHIIQLADTGQ